MKRIFSLQLVILFFVAIFSSGCVSSPVQGVLYSDIKHSGLGTVSIKEEIKSTKEGKASCKGFLGLFAVGNCTIEEAKQNGQISKIGSVSYKTTSYLGIYTKYTTIVKGE